MATKIKHLKVGGTTYDLAATTADSMGEANLTWGGKNFSGSFGPMDAALNPVLSANRLAGMDPAGITVEYSTNGGSTWSTYSLSDAQKIALVTTSTTIRIGGPTASQTANSQVRVTLDGVSGGVYTALNKLHIYVSTSYSNGCTVTLESYDYNSSTSWHTILTEGVGGWSGWNVLNFSLPGTGCFGGENNNQHQRKIRLTFKHTGITSGQESNGLCIFKIYGYGGVGWGAPSQLATSGTPYYYDEYLNVTFPGQVTATKFNGNATGLVDAGNGSQITANYSASGMPYSSVSWLAAWNGYSLQSISKDEFVGNNADSVSTALNKLSAGTDTPSDNDFYICQYAGGGTTTTTYHRRPVYALWNYIKGKADNAYVAKGTIATSSVAGLVKPVSVITKPTINSTTTTSGRYYSVQMSSDGAMFVNVPWSAGSDTHYLAYNYIGAADASTNGSTTNGNTYLKLYENGNKRSQFKISGSGATSVTSDSNGNITIYSSNTDSKTSSSNTTSKIYLVGPTSQSSSGQTTYSNSSCYASGGYLYSNGKKVDMDSISGGVEWGTF